MQQTGKNQNNFLLSLENQILSEYEANKYQIRYLFTSLLSLKPHYEIVRYFKKDKFFQNNQWFLNHEQKQKDCICVSIEIYDSIEKRNKFLQIYLLNTYYSNLFYTFQNIAHKVQSIGPTNLILQLLDFYGLETDPTTSQPIYIDFFVAEFEMFDMTLKEYMEAFDVKDNQIINLIEKQINYCLEISQMNRNIYQTSFQDVYISTDESGDIKVKINLLQKGMQEELAILNHSYITYNKEQFQIKQNVGEDQLKLDDGTLKFSQQKRDAIHKFSEGMKNTNFSELEEQIGSKISSDQFIKQVLSKNPYAFEIHGQAVFRIISENPKYQQLEIIEMNKKKFVFKVIQTDGKTCYLECKKCSSLTEAQKLQQQYQKLIDASLIKEITTMTKVELIETENKQYSLLLEKKNRVENNTDEKHNLITIIQQEQLKGTNSYLRELIELSLDLFIKHSIQITRINPCQILASKQQSSMEEENQGGENVLNFKINDFDEDDYTYFYVQCIQQYFLNISKDIQEYMKELIKQFFDYISQGKEEQLEETNLKIQKFYENMNHIKNLEQKSRLNNFNVEINFNDHLFDKINVLIQSFKLTKSIPFFLNLMNNLSLNNFKFNKFITSEQVFQYQKKVMAPALNLNQKHQDLINTFCSEIQENNEYLNNLITSELIKIIKNNEIALNLSIEQTVFELKDITLLNKNFEEEKELSSIKDIFNQNQTCLKIGFCKQNSNDFEETSFIKLAIFDNIVYVILCESPLIIQLQNSQNCVLSFEEYFLRSEQYQNLKYLLPSSHQKFTFNDMILLQLLITKNIKSITQLVLNLRTINLQRFDGYKIALADHGQLQKLSICIDYNKHPNQQGFFIDAEKDPLVWENVAIKIKELVNSPKSLNTFILGVRQNKEERNLKLLRSKIYKSTRLVSFNIEIAQKAFD